jgi:hypothetical protein
MEQSIGILTRIDGKNGILIGNMFYPEYDYLLGASWQPGVEAICWDNCWDNEVEWYNFNITKACWEKNINPKDNINKVNYNHTTVFYLSPSATIENSDTYRVHVLHYQQYQHMALYSEGRKVNMNNNNMKIKCNKYKILTNYGSEGIHFDNQVFDTPEDAFIYIVNNPSNFDRQVVGLYTLEKAD